MILVRNNTVNDGGQERGKKWKEGRNNLDQNLGRMRGFRSKYLCQDGCDERGNLLPLREGEWAKTVGLGRRERRFSQLFKLLLTFWNWKDVQGCEILTLFAKHRLLAKSPVRKSSKNIDVWEIWLQRKFYEELMSHIKFTAMKETPKNIVCSGPLRIESWAFILALFPRHPLRLFFRSLILMVLDE